MVLFVIYLAMLIIVGTIGMKFALAVAPYIDKAMSFVWQDPAKARHAKVAKRVKELCIDGDVPDETAILLTSKEQSLTEKHVNDALGELTPEVMRTIAKGDYMSIVTKSMLKASKKMKGA